MTKKLYVYEDGSDLIAKTSDDTGHLLRKSGSCYASVHDLSYGKSGQDISNVVAVLYDPKFDLAGRLYSISGIKIINDDKITVNQKEALKSMIGKQEPKTTSYHVVMEDSYGDEWGFVKIFGFIVPTEADKDEYYTFDTKEEAEKYLIPGAYLEEV